MGSSKSAVPPTKVTFQTWLSRAASGEALREEESIDVSGAELIKSNAKNSYLTLLTKHSFSVIFSRRPTASGFGEKGEVTSARHPRKVTP
jgi:hypothetical protein